MTKKKEAPLMSTATHYTYILRCFDNTLYTGWTKDLKGRICAHNAGLGAKYTRGRLPVELVYYEEFDSKSEAMTRECVIKKMSRNKKLELIKIKEGRGY